MLCSAVIVSKTALIFGLTAANKYVHVTVTKDLSIQRRKDTNLMLGAAEDKLLVVTVSVMAV